MRPFRFTGKTVFITGGGSGIGEATAELFASEGANVVVADIVGDDASRVAATLTNSLALTLDVGDAKAVNEGIAHAERQFGKIDVIFNNAGIAGAFEPLHEGTLENWHRVTRVNGDGVFHVLKFGIAAMLRGGGGAIINTASVASLVATTPNLSSYIYTKAGIAGLTRAAACGYATRGIRVNAVAPGQVLTPLIEKAIAESNDPLAERARRENLNPMPGFIMPRDVATAVAFLASEDARWITGVVLPSDGGYVAR
jgi:NAD(P)-dependent dehydrogenase (short-subunit alcohol dehydrogenase family)